LCLAQLLSGLTPDFGVITPSMVDTVWWPHNGFLYIREMFI
jgi:hypothetical protein